jgi:fucose 4-O-acetylase-like acetyltransferase
VSPTVYPRYDFWHTSPAYFAVKAGVVLLTMAAAYLLDRLPGQGPIRQLGRTSLLIYWVHLEIVYGSYVVPGWRGSLPLGQAVAAVATLMLVMLALSYARTARKA